MSAPTAVILAAGRGTRMRSDVPKVLHELCGLPMGLWPVRAALAAGAGRVVVVDSPERPLAEVLPEGVELVVQPQANGTGGAVLAAAGALDADAPVVVLSGDVPLVSAAAIAELVAAHAAGGAAATMATTVLADPSGYGRVVRDAAGAIAKVVETKAPGDASAAELEIDEVNTGIYVFDGAALLATLPRLSADNAQGELYLPQALDLLRADGARIAAHVIDDPRLVLGVNDGVALAHVRGLAQRAILERHMLAGVTVVDPASTCDRRRRPDRATTRASSPGSSLRGATEVGTWRDGRPTHDRDRLADRRARERARLVARRKPRSARARASARSRTCARARCCARARRRGRSWRSRTRTSASGAKIPHLSYIGDADVGAGANLGAGTITANYDGHAKHRTTIGARVRGGVDTAFVAPVTVGDDAYTAAGSVDHRGRAPRRAGGRARAPAATVEGYAQRRAAEHDASTRSTTPRAPAPGTEPARADDPQRSR